MILRRFFVSPDAIVGNRVLLTAELVRHAGKVLRLSVDDKLLLLDGTGNHYRGRIESLTARDGVVRIEEQWFEAETNLPLRLIQALPKGDKFDLVLQKGCELGVSRFSPVLSERSVSLPDRSKREKKRQRWQRIVNEAARQSGRPQLPVCDPPQALDQILEDSNEALKLMLWEEESQPLAACLPETPPQDAAILVGPEGGFSRDEAARAVEAGFRLVSLGPRILRTETAGFAVTAVLEYLYGDFGSCNNTVT